MVNALPRPSTADTKPASAEASGSAALAALLRDPSFQTVRELLLVSTWLAERSECLDE